MEIWKDVPGTYGKIQVSNNGKVRSLLRGEPYELKCQKDKKGYMRLRVTINRKKMSFKLHRLVAEAFIDNPEQKSQVNHMDGNKANNDVSNLEWVSNKENVHHAIEHGLWENVNRFNGPAKARAGKRTSRWNNPNPPKPIRAYRGLEIIDFDSISEAEKYFSSRHICDVLKGKRPHVKGWSFEYRKEVVS